MLTVAQRSRVPWLLRPYWLPFAYRQLLWKSIRVTLNGRYAGSLLGLVWVIIGPLILLGLYALIYTVIFRIRPMGMERTDYILYIFSGLIPFLAVGQALATGTSSLSDQKDLLLNAVFPPELLPLREVLISGVTLVVGLGLVAIFKFATGEPNLTWLLIPVIIFSLALAVTGMVWFLALLNLFIKDIQQILTYVIIMLLITSPIAYTPDMVQGMLKVLLYVNPLAYYVMSLQSIIVLGELPPIEMLIGTVVIGLVAFHGMYAVFQKVKRAALDYV